MKDFIIWKKPEYKRFGKVNIAAYIPKEAKVPPTFSEIEEFDHHQWVIPKGLNPFAYKAYQLPLDYLSNTIKTNLKSYMLETKFQQWMNGRATITDNHLQVDGNECIYTHNINGEITVLIPKTRKVKFSKECLQSMWSDFEMVGVPCFNENGEILINSIYPTDIREWSIPNGLNLNNYWCPILCYDPNRQCDSLKYALAFSFVNEMLLDNKTKTTD